jgi:benzaldehyde dehydrogenase (NAD)
VSESAVPGQAADHQDQSWQDCLFADGEFRRPRDGGQIGIRDKSSGEIFARAGLATKADADQAIAAAAAAQPGWAARTYAERAALLRDGATVVAGGTTDGLFFRPTVVTGVRRDSRLWSEEIFAPIAPILVVGTEDEAREVANDTAYGLVSSVLTADPYRGLTFARGLTAAMVHVNDATPQDEALAPFGGRGQSGPGGRSGGDANLEEFTERRWLTVTPGPAHYPY